MMTACLEMETCDRRDYGTFVLLMIPTNTANTPPQSTACRLQDPLLLVTVSISLKQQQQQLLGPYVNLYALKETATAQQQQQQHSQVSPLGYLSFSGQQRVLLLSGLAQLAGVDRLAVGLTRVEMQQQQQQQQRESSGEAVKDKAAAGVASLTCTVSVTANGCCCHWLVVPASGCDCFGCLGTNG
jgi:hypothetical protein